MVTMRWLEDAGGELATTGGGDEGTVLAEKARLEKFREYLEKEDTQ